MTESRPRPGDRVTIHRDGFDPTAEWEVIRGEPDYYPTWVRRDGWSITIDPRDLRIVPPPAEPGVGQVVFADGAAWFRTQRWWLGYIRGVDGYQIERSTNWNTLAEIARPAVPKPTIAEIADAIRHLGIKGYSYEGLAERLAARLWPGTTP